MALDFFMPPVIAGHAAGFFLAKTPQKIEKPQENQAVEDVRENPQRDAGLATKLHIEVVEL